ncbi:MAG: ABC transporter ATP-binding protein [Candidatus Firestonebacteria bacterium]
MENNSLIRVNNIYKSFKITKGVFEDKRLVYAVNGVSFDIKQGETLGLVGESGCGKSTIGKMIINLIPLDKGEVWFGHEKISHLHHKELRLLRFNMQIIFQDPFASLNPRIRVGNAVGEILKIYKQDNIEQKVKHILEIVGLSKDSYYKYPHEFSGGQRQRICIARALISNPKFVVCDEPVSSLDVSIQSQIINLLKDLKEEFKLTYLFISHDLRVIRNISDRIAVMYLGKIVELGNVDSICESSLHPYTQALISAVPGYEKKRIILKGEIPSPTQLPTGCYFYSRCYKKFDKCKEKQLDLIEVNPAHFVACCNY